MGHISYCAGQPKLEGYFFQLLNCSVAAAGSFEVNNIIWRKFIIDNPNEEQGISDLVH